MHSLRRNIFVLALACLSIGVLAGCMNDLPRFSLPTSTPEPFSTLRPGEIVPTPVMNRLTLDGLALEEYAIVSDEIDTPAHFEFNQRIPKDILEKGRVSSPGTSLLEINQILEPFGYQMRPVAGSQPPDQFDLYKGAEKILGPLYGFRPVSTNQSGTDFALVVENNRGQNWLVRKDSASSWEPGQHHYRPPVFAGDVLVTVDRLDNDPNAILVRKNGQEVFRFQRSGMDFSEPVKSLGVWDGQWVLEVDGTLWIDGQSYNQKKGYAEIFGWQLLNGKPFYLYRKAGVIHLSYAEQDLPITYTDVIHNRCCEPAAFNINTSPSAVRFYARRDGMWHYVILGKSDQ